MGEGGGGVIVDAFDFGHFTDGKQNSLQVLGTYSEEEPAIVCGYLHNYSTLQIGTEAGPEGSVGVIEVTGLEEYDPVYHKSASVLLGYNSFLRVLAPEGKTSECTMILTDPEAAFVIARRGGGYVDGLADMKVVFNGEDGEADYHKKMEATGGVNFPESAEDFDDPQNFVFAELVVGSEDAEDPITLELAQMEGQGGALYVKTLTIDLHGTFNGGSIQEFPLYYLDKDDEPERLYMGDAELDGDVDLEDLFAVRNHFGSGELIAWSNGNFDGDDAIDLDDLFSVRNNFGYGMGSGGRESMGGEGEGGEGRDSTYATLTLTAEVAAAYDPDTWEEVTPTPDHTTLLEETYWWQIDFCFEIEDIPDGFQGFGGMCFNVDVSEFDDAISWQADNTKWSPQYPPGVQYPIWSDNGDYGPGGSDFEGIVVAISGFSEDPNDPRGELSQVDLTLIARQMGLIDESGVLVMDEDGTFVVEGVTFGGGS